MSDGPVHDARSSLVDAAYDLFSEQGVRAVGIDAIVARAGVARMTLYRHFASKEALVLEFLRERERRWTIAWLRGEVERTADPAQRLLAVFDAFDPWFRRDDFEGCAFINVLLETSERASPVRAAAVTQLAGIRAFLSTLAHDAGVADADGLAREWHILMKGSIVAAAEGDVDAAQRARRVGVLVLADHGVPV